MAKIAAAPQLNMLAHFEVTEQEARFLDALFGYGGEELLRVVKAYLGRAYIEKYEVAGLRMIAQMRPELAGILRQFDDARAVFHAKPESVSTPAGRDAKE